MGWHCRPNSKLPCHIIRSCDYLFSAFDYTHSYLHLQDDLWGKDCLKVRQPHRTCLSRYASSACSSLANFLGLWSTLRTSSSTMPLVFCQSEPAAVFLDKTEPSLCCCFFFQALFCRRLSFTYSLGSPCLFLSAASHPCQLCLRWMEDAHRYREWLKILP